MSLSYTFSGSLKDFLRKLPKIEVESAVEDIDDELS